MKLFIIKKLFFLLTVILVVVGCKKESKDNNKKLFPLAIIAGLEQNKSSTCSGICNSKVPDITKGISQDTLNNSLVSISTNMDTIVFKSDPALNNISVGDVIAGDISDKTPYGFLRKVDSKENQNGQIVVKTSQATLEEAFEELTVNLDNYNLVSKVDSKPQQNLYPIKKSVSSPGVLGGGEFEFSFSKTKYLSDSLSLTTEMDYSIPVSVMLKVEKHKFTGFLFIVNIEGKHSMTFKSENEIGGKIEKQLWEKDFTPIRLLIPTPVGIPIPLILVPKASLNVGAEIKINSVFKAGLQREISGYYGIRCCSYPTIVVNKPKTDKVTPIFETEVSLDSRAYGNITGSLIVNNIVGPYFKLEPAVHAFGSTSDKPPVAKLNYAPALGLGIDFSILTKNFSEFSKTFNAPDNVPLLKDFSLNVTNKEIEFTYSLPETKIMEIPFKVVEIPTFTPAAGNYESTQTVSLTTSTSGAAIYYTTDGTTPTCTSILYESPISVTSDTVIKAIACASGYKESDVAVGNYTIGLKVATPQFSLSGGNYSTSQSVTITTSTNGATIRYTTSGTTPTCSTGTIYSSPVIISVTSTLQAIGCLVNYRDSSIASSTYNFPGTKQLSWGTFREQYNGTISFISDNNYDSGRYIGLNLLWMKCSQGQTWNSTSNSCDGTAQIYQFCNENDNDCSVNGTLGSFQGNGVSTAYNTCNSLNSGSGYAGRTNWRVATYIELESLVYCSDYSAGSYEGCGTSNRPKILTPFFPATGDGIYLSSYIYVNNVCVVAFSTGMGYCPLINPGFSSRSLSGYIRCVSSN